jgi:flavodoxin
MASLCSLKRPALIVFKSIHHDNTRHVAERMGQELHAKLVDAHDAATTLDAAVELIGVGSGIYYGMLHHEVRSWVTGLPTGAGVGREAFVFSTSGLPFLTWFYHRWVVWQLRRKGFKIVGEFACCGHDSFAFLRWFGGLNRTHPDERDLSHAKEFARSLVQGSLPDTIDST